METKFKQHTGVITAIVTPMIYGEVDEIGLNRLIEYQIKNNVDGIVPCGTTGESATITRAEQEEVISQTVKQVKGRIPVIAGAGANSTSEAIELTKMAKKAGADAVLSVAPYYNRPSDSGQRKHFMEIANKCNIPIILYNVPSRTGSNISSATVSYLSRHQNIIGIKEASGDLRQISEVCQKTPKNFTVLSGDDFTCLPTIAIGGQGVISVVSNVVPKQMTDMVHHGLSGDFITARKKHEQLFNLMAAMFYYPSPAPAKKALELLNIIQVAEIRLPMTEMDEASNQELISVMRAMRLI